MGMIHPDRRESIPTAEAIALKMLHGIKQRQAFLALLQTTSDQCWQILLHIYCAATMHDRSADVLSANLDMPMRVANRYFALLNQYGYIEQRKTEDGEVLELTIGAASELETLLIAMG
jgi:hypothetical protein